MLGVTGMDVDIVRAKRIDTGEWVTGFYLCLIVQGDKRHFIVQEGNSTITADMLIEIDYATKCRCTGVPDKTGKVVFEGDLLSQKTVAEFPLEERGFSEVIPVHVVVFENSVYEGCPAFKVISVDGVFYHNYMRSLSEREVIGNIYDNAVALV